MKVHQISEDDLAALERDVPALAEALMPHMTNPLRCAIRRIKRVLADVRWNYGPPEEVEIIPDQEQ